jgi:UDPglucose 6-dehydrogenase
MPSTGPVGFLGLSHLGLVTSIAWASLGEHVIGVDPDRDTVAALARTELPIHEPGLAELVRAAQPRLTFTSDVASLGGCPLVIVSRDVPTMEDNRGDVSVVERLVDTAAPHLRPRTTIVIMSQLPPGFTRAIAERIHRRDPEKALRVFYWVETLVFGRAVDRVLHPERIILGCENPAAALPEVLERRLQLFDCPVLRMRLESAELTKAAINLYLSCGVTFANTLSDVCELIGADWSEVVPALQLDARIGPAAYIRPSLGISGGNLERDLLMLRHLAEERGVDAPLVETIVTYNARRLRWVTDKLESLVFTSVADPTVAMWGLAYKKGTASTKNAPAVRVLSSIGPRAHIRVYDPAVRSPVLPAGAALVSSRDEALVGADCVVIMTDWDEFAGADPEVFRRLMRRPVVIDCVGILEGRRHGMSGVRYVSMGRGETA